MYKIMIVEDDMTIARILNENLIKWGFESKYVTDFTNITAWFLEMEPHLVLMDISLPFYNGYYWCSEIRKTSKVPIVFISSNNTNMDIVMAINMGGDDFITKPFSLDIVTAKIQALLRRAYSYQGEIKVLEHKGTILNLSEAALYYNEIKIDLTKNEFKILEILLQNKGSVVGRDMIMKKLWDSDSFIDDNTLTVNMNRLRKKLESYGLEDYITTKKGLGYLINADTVSEI